MASADLIRSCIDSIRQIKEHLADSILYIDAGCLEAFQFIGAFPVLLELGVHVVCSLENASPLDAFVSWNSMFVGPARRLVIITSRLLSDAHRYILRCLGMHRNVPQCIIFTSISEIAHSAYADSPLGPDAFHEYESLLTQDYEELLKKSEKKGLHFHKKSVEKSTSDYKENLTSENDGWAQLSSGEINQCVEAESQEYVYADDSINARGAEEFSRKLLVSVHHFPMILCPLSPRVFVLPSEGTVAEACLSNDSEDSVGPGLPSISNGSSSDSDDVPPGATLTANFLYHLAAKMDLKMDIFSLGDTSRIIGKMLMDMSSLYDVGRRNKKSAGLLLIDRTLDLLTPCCHGDSFLDRLLCSLPRRGRISSSLPSKAPQSPKIGSDTKVHRAPLDIRIPFGTVFSKDEHAMNSNQLSEGIGAFVSGWNSRAIGSESADYADKFSDDAIEDEYNLLSGSFLSNYAGANYLESLLDRRAKDGAILIKKWLLETLQHENVNLNLKGRSGLLSASELHSMLKRLARNQMSLIQNKGIIQLALAAEIALGEPHSSRWDAFVNAEKILTITSLDTSQSLSSQILDFINTSILARSNEQDRRNKPTQSLISFQDALLLAMIGYILAGERFPTSASSGPFSWQEEHSLKEAIVDAVMENPSSANLHFLHGLCNELAAKLNKEQCDFPKPSQIDDFDDEWGSWDNEDTDHQNDQAYGDMQLKLELRDRVDQLFKFFNKLSSLKRRNLTLREGLVASNKYGTDMDTHKCLLYKLLTTLLAKYDISGLEYHSSAVGRLLKSGFGRFGLGLGQAKPSFGDQNILLVFVVGGINSLEIREAMEAVAEYGRPDMELIIGGTTLLTPTDMFDLLLGSSSYI
ncbi:sec1 family domain-containing protein MIP3 isoform X1 [Canna indica]|uniref:Sec1 family domain-containing protein MIP3 isoform X1 n=1 Tax=Canna indica TaxID=4628 RepID=A0AAQ3QHD1_9LILI|nr:sec1 family domain-containing protein MIP3 isoform X1 [Canna indica]